MNSILNSIYYKNFRSRNYDSPRKSITIILHYSDVKTVEKFYLSGVCVDNRKWLRNCPRY